MNSKLQQGRARWIAVWALAALVFPLGARALAGEGIQNWGFQDGSLSVYAEASARVFAFPFIPFLESHPVWTPSLPRAYGAEPEEVAPLAGLGGLLRVGTLDATTGGFQPFHSSNLKAARQTPYHFEGILDQGVGSLKWVAPLGAKGIDFVFQNDTSAETVLRFELEGFPYKTHWGVPSGKLRHDWGVPRWEMSPDNRALLHSYSNTLDATRSPCSALWFEREWKRHAFLDLPETAPGPAAWIEIAVPAGSRVRFGFLHADRERDLEYAIRDRRAAENSFESEIERWKDWIDTSLQQIANRLKLSAPSPRSALEAFGAYGEPIVETLARTRTLFLSNGGVLTRPMSLGEFPLDVRDQGVGLNHWIALGLEFPYLAQWRDLARYNTHSERGVSIEVMTGERIDRFFRGQTVVMASPDPQRPPSKRLMDILLGFVVSGGKVTLVDGVFGFDGKEGWWTREGFRDPADYALRSLGIELDPASRRILDEEGLDEEVNTFCIGAPVYLDGNSKTPIETRTVVPGGGYLLVYPRSSKSDESLILSRLRLGEYEFVPFTRSEDEILAASYGTRAARNAFGAPSGRTIAGEGYAAYRLPKGTTVECALELSGKWKVAWSAEPPRTAHTLLKKAFQDWYLRELLTVDLSRLAHPVVYSATWGARIFDVTGTEVSPLLYRKIGRGSFVWIGLPRDYLLQGSDTGTDGQNPLRRDPSYDLVRMTLALHDPERGGGQQAGAPPARGWTTGWSRSTAEGPRSDCAFFAWRPTRFLGGGAGGVEYWSWAMDCFTQALELPEREGQRMEIGALATRSWEGGGEIVDLYTNACRHALYSDMAVQADRQGLEWRRNQAEGRAEAIANDLIAVLDVGSAAPVWGRVVKDGSAEEVLPLEAFLPEAVWTASEIRGARFPGGEEARDRVIRSLLEQAESILDPRARAALATLPGANVEEILSGVFPGEEFDLTVALPAMRALCEKLAKPGGK